jgi:hypothetical protein
MGLEKVLEQEGFSSLADKKQEDGDNGDQKQQTNQPEDTQKQNTDGQEAQKQEESKDEQEEHGRQTQQRGEKNTEKTDQESKTQTEIKPEDALRVLNEQLETKFKDFDEIKGLTTTKDKLSEYEAKLQQKDEALNSIGDPYSSFADEAILKANEIKKQNKDLSTSVAFKLASTDVDNLSDDDVLVMQRIIENPHYEGQEGLMKEIVDEDYGLISDKDEDELTDADKRRIERQKTRKGMDAKKAREALKSMSDVQAPQKKDVEQEYQEKVKNYIPQAEKLIDEQVDKLTIGKDEYEHEIDSSFKDFLKKDNNLARTLAKSGYDLSNPQEVQKVVDWVKNLYFAQNKDKVINDVVEQERARMRDQQHKEVHNPKETDKKEKPQASAKEQKNLEEQQRALDSLRGRKRK